jgi:hypothetical protein
MARYAPFIALLILVAGIAVPISSQRLAGALTATPTPTLGPTNTPTAPPEAPTGLQAATVFDALKITLFWDDNSLNESGFIIEMSTEGSDGPWLLIETVPPNAIFANAGGLADGETYWFRVSAENGAGMSGYSNVAKAMAVGPPDTPGPTPAGKLGDTDGNGTINAIDVALVLQYHASLLDNLASLYRADANGDSRVDSLDAFLILQFTFCICPVFS